MARKANIYNELTDAELIKKFNEFDAAAFEEIYNRYWIKMFYHASRMLQDVDQAGDFVQDVFLKLLSLRGRLEAMSLPAFLYTSTRNLVLNAIKHEKVKNVHLSQLSHLIRNQMETDYSSLQDQLFNKIEAEIDQLSPKMREAFVLNRKDRLSPREIAALTGASENTVRQHIKVALRILRSKLSLLFQLFVL